MVPQAVFDTRLWQGTQCSGQTVFASQDPTNEADQVGW